MKTLDSIRLLRVAACLGVFVAHLAPHMGASGRIAAAANFGASGVYLFFLISGFLACRGKEIRPGGGMRGIAVYYWKRLLRILPLYYVVILGQMLLHGLILRDVPPDPAGLYWLRYFLLTNACIPGPDNFWSNLGATWTVSLFVFFYLCAPLFVRLTAGKLHRTALLYLAAIALRYGWAASGLSSYMMAFHYLHYFVLGMLLYELAARYRPAAAAVRLACFLAATGIALWCGRMELDYFMVVSWGYGLLFLMLGNLTFRKPVGAFARTVGALDACSYAIYLVHAPVLEGIGMLRAHVQMSGAAVCLLAVFLTAIGTWAVHTLIEKPLERWKRKV